MGVEENKKIVLGFIENMSAGNGAAAFGALADSATWRVAGNFALSGTKTKAQFAEVAGELTFQLLGGPTPPYNRVETRGARVHGLGGKTANLKISQDHHKQ